ncbi:MAG: nuclear transport factor 2 family protein [Janthinobacterium lividum]
MHHSPLDTLLHKEAIRNLRTLYGHYLDSNHLAGLDAVFAPDAIIQVVKEPWRGIAEVRAGLEQALRDYDPHGYGTYPFIHAITNHWVEITGPTTAQGRCYLLNLAAGPEVPSEKLPLFLGIYSDEYELIGGHWFITRSRMDVAWPTRNIQGGIPGVNLVLPD